jgi:Flp pilus assembly protein TadG
MAEVNYQRGQSLAEFALIAPLLFIFFFALIQITYTAYAAFAVQRAAFAIAHEAAASDDPKSYDPYFQLAYCLAPLGQINSTTMATVLATHCEINVDDPDYVHVQISYPMPIWIPLVGKIFGQPFQVTSALRSPMENTLERVFEALGKPKPDLSFKQLSFPNVLIYSFSAEALNEGSIGYQKETK